MSKGGDNDGCTEHDGGIEDKGLPSAHVPQRRGDPGQGQGHAQRGGAKRIKQRHAMEKTPRACVMLAGIKATILMIVLPTNAFKLVRSADERRV